MNSARNSARCSSSVACRTCRRSGRTASRAGGSAAAEIIWKLPFLLARREPALHRRHVPQRRLRRGLRPPAPPGTPDSDGEDFGSSSSGALGFGQLGAGMFLLLFCGQMAAGAAFFLALFILLYNFCHKFFNAAPWLMGACRFWVYVIAGAAGAWGSERLGDFRRTWHWRFTSSG
jgi:hypothetical protein